MTKVVSWNVSKRQEPWRQHLKMDADVAPVTGGRRSAG